MVAAFNFVMYFIVLVIGIFIFLILFKLALTIKTLTKELQSNNFRKMIYVGITNYFISITLTTFALFFGREVLLISLVILNPVIKLGDIILGFSIKYWLYKKLKLNFDTKK